MKEKDIQQAGGCLKWVSVSSVMYASFTPYVPPFLSCLIYSLRPKSVRWWEAGKRIKGSTPPLLPSMLEMWEVSQTHRN